MPRLLLEGGLVADGQAPPRPATVVLDGDRIVGVFDPAAPQEGERVDCAGLLVTAGLVDAHTHLLSSGAHHGYDEELLFTSLPLRTLRGAAHARLALDHGFTTMRDVCTEGAQFADVALRDAVTAGLIEGPRVIPSGPGLGITGGYLPGTYASPACGLHGCTIVDGVEPARAEVRRQVAHGVEWIKVFADWPTSMPGGRRQEAIPTYSTAELEAIVDEARRRRRRVAAHATSDAGAAHAVRCGVSSIEHLGPLSRETLDLMAERGVFLVPTFTVLEQFLENATTENVVGGMTRSLEAARAAFGRALEAGVRIVAGTDIGCFPHMVDGRRELASMARLGMSASRVLAAATVEAGALLDIEGLGTLTPGAPADVCGFTIEAGEDPLPSVWAKPGPRLVIAGGKVVRGGHHVVNRAADPSC